MQETRLRLIDPGFRMDLLSLDPGAPRIGEDGIWTTAGVAARLSIVMSWTSHTRSLTGGWSSLNILAGFHRTE